MRLLSPDQFAAVFEPLTKWQVGYIRPVGNVGDRLIEMATFQLFQEFGVRWKIQSRNGELEKGVDHLVFGGGGNMGQTSRNNWILRGEILRFGLPITILPQSFMSREGRDYFRIHVRERESFKLCPSATLAPDLALGLNWTVDSPATKELGIFLRRDRETAVKWPWRRRDPAKFCDTPLEYLQLASQYRQIITDRLHFAIAGLITGRIVVLLPNSYHKNQSMFATHLQSLGCLFATTVREARAMTAATSTRRLWWRAARSHAAHADSYLAAGAISGSANKAA
jgi:exopolysaccharide biosynthesis predicted pyruvyltransferase EpsI